MSRMKRLTVLAGTLLVFMLASRPARAQCIPLVCSLTVSLQSDASGLALSGSGSSAAGMSFGTITAFGGSLPGGVSRSATGSNFTISTPFDIKVSCQNLGTLLPCTIILTPSYNLTAQLQTSDSTNTWKIGGTTLNSASAATLISGGTYGAVTALTFALTIPFSESPGVISNTINFVAISN